MNYSSYNEHPDYVTEKELLKKLCIRKMNKADKEWHLVPSKFATQLFVRRETRDQFVYRYATNRHDGFVDTGSGLLMLNKFIRYNGERGVRECLEICGIDPQKFMDNIDGQSIMVLAAAVIEVYGREKRESYEALRLPDGDVQKALDKINYPHVDMDYTWIETMTMAEAKKKGLVV